MILNFTDMLYALSYALDAVESEFNGIMEGHGKRVAWISACMGRTAGMSRRELIDLTGLAILHDNAVVEFAYHDPAESAPDRKKYVMFEDWDSFRGHCIRGEKRIRLMPFITNPENVILYHHENADGSGPFGKTAENIPPAAQIIHLADTVDVYLHFGRISEKDREQVERFVLGNRGIMFSPRIVDLFMETFDTAMVKSVEEMGVTRSLRSVVPEGVKDFSPKEIQGITDFFAGIVDDKSSFTRDHSVGVARKAEEMARFYGWSEEKAERFRFAGAFHDIGKLVVNNDILEKPGRLTGDEFLEMQNHASQTYKVLSGIRGCEDITEWAANHHEKLDGSGYPRGLTEQQLSFEDRLMACIDVYQALREKRPYKDGLTHSRTIAVMRDMAARRKLDGGIIRDMDRVFGTQTGREVS